VNLRPRLALATVVVAAPLIAGLILFDGQRQRADAQERLARLVRDAFADPRAEIECAADPVAWSGPLTPFGRPPQVGPRLDRPAPPPAPRFGSLPPDPRHASNDPARPSPPREGPAAMFVYDEALVPARADAPTLSPELRDALGSEELVAIPGRWGSNDIALVSRVGAGRGACAFVLARGTVTGARVEAWVPPLRVWLAPLFVVVVTMLIAAGPIVARTRRLTEWAARQATAGEHAPIALGGDDELSRLAEAFNRASRTIHDQLADRTRRERALRDFLANTLHDVMTPLTVLKGQLTSLREGAADPQSAIASAIREAGHLSAVLENLAVAARLDAVEPELVRSPVELGDLLARVVERHRPIAEQTAVSIQLGRPGAPLVVEADVTLLERAVGNLVFNAIDHNRAGGRAAVALETARPDRFRIRVLDDGPGVAPGELERLIERGYRGEGARTRLRAGQGLGLSIASRVARLHGYTLSFRSPPEGGLEAELEGPVRRG